MGCEKHTTVIGANCVSNNNMAEVVFFPSFIIKGDKVLLPLELTRKYSSLMCNIHIALNYKQLTCLHQEVQTMPPKIHKAHPLTCCMLCDCSNKCHFILSQR